jgi:hypothetical protein
MAHAYGFILLLEIFTTAVGILYGFVAESLFPEFRKYYGGGLLP